MTVAALFASHTPLRDHHSPGPEIEQEVAACFEALTQWVADFNPDVVIALGPDHFNGFFYRLMPGFCIGTALESVGDWNTPAGPIPVAAALAEECVAAVQRGGVDVAISHHMHADHGLTQLLMQLFEWSRLPALIPVFVNCAAPPLPPLARCDALGRALGNFAAQLPGRVLITASGGLSHDPPIPTLADAPAAVRERLIMGGPLSADARAARELRVLDDAARQGVGQSERRALNAAWDRAFLKYLIVNDGAALARLDDDGITRDAGCGGHEIRTWVAAAAAARAAGVTAFEQHYYRAIPQWVAGFGVMTAR